LDDVPPIIRGNTLYCVVQHRITKAVYVACVDLDTFETRYLLACAEGNFRELQYVDDVNVYCGGSKGLQVYPLDGSEFWTLEQVKDNLPSSGVWVRGTLGGWCYVQVGSEWIVRVNLETREWEQLSSSRAKEGKTPFIDGKRLGGMQAIDDPKRERIIFKQMNGGDIWAIEKGGEFVLLYNGRSSGNRQLLLGFLDNGDRLLFQDVQAILTYNCETSALSVIGNAPFFKGCVWNG
jgi:hypothetical protein